MKCPNCSHVIFAINTLDSEYLHNGYYDAVEGTCSNCGKSYRWIEVYVFERYEDIEEICKED